MESPNLNGRRIVVVGDLNAAADALRDVLLGTGLVDERIRWIGGDSELIQLGDIFNGGGGAREAFDLLFRLRREARRAGGRVTILLGNHEVMMALGYEGDSTEAEYLGFASKSERASWEDRVLQAYRRMSRAKGVVLPLEPRLESWKISHVPGRAALRRALKPSAKLGREVRALPVVVQRGDTIFVHAGLTPRWAKLGVEGLNRAARDAWRRAPRYFSGLDWTGILRARDAPVWDRTFVRDEDAEALLAETLDCLGARRMVIGHTPTKHVTGGKKGEVLLRYGGRVVCIDVSLGSGDGAPRAALIIEEGQGFVWTPQGLRSLWG